VGESKTKTETETETRKESTRREAREAAELARRQASKARAAEKARLATLKRRAAEEARREAHKRRVIAGLEGASAAFNLMVGETIRRLRQGRGWTQVQLAEQARLSSNYVARLERGELGPSLFVANKLCKACDVNLDALVSHASKGRASPAPRVARA
jgi:ribosome-binding protein aMBF1 (putative translation factor)